MPNRSVIGGAQLEAEHDRSSVNTFKHIPCSPDSYTVKSTDLFELPWTIRRSNSDFQEITFIPHSGHKVLSHKVMLRNNQVGFDCVGKLKNVEHCRVVLLKTSGKRKPPIVDRPWLKADG